MSKFMQESCQKAVLDLILNGPDSIDEFDEELDKLAEYQSDMRMRMGET